MLPAYESVVSLRRKLKDDYEDTPLNGSYTQQHREPSQYVNVDPTQQQIINTCLKDLQSNLNNESVKQNPRYYHDVLISKLCCQQILQHAISGGDNEIMGMLVGITHGSSFIVTQSFPLPILGTETRVNAMSESYEYMVQYMDEMFSEADKMNHVVGWYHSHPGYDCWLSKIDMSTQNLNQSYQDPYLAIVVDPKKSVDQSAIRIGAFRTLDSGFKDNVNDDHENTTTGDLPPDENLTFYELPMRTYASNLDMALRSNKLSHRLVQSDVNYETQLFEDLFDSMNQINNFNELVVEEDPRSLDMRTDFASESMGPSNHDAGESKRTKVKRSISNSMRSTPSIDNDSDIDMIHDIYSEKEADIESVTSSVGTAPESSFTYLRSHYNNGSTNESSPGNFLTLQRRLFGNGRAIDEALSSMQESTDSLRMNANRESKLHSIDDLTFSLQKNNLRSAYNRNKRDLLRYKMQEYKNYRFYRDTFTI
ncbi:COP9 signalosome catalytic subunit RRI1 [Maudiozyma barnettii]|uniref:COP9 signalosome complex subunit 5 n=1 Tax=Maudiozyma barnettii TaxID=61262 RepID=A0A8H2VI20_9SACH|nr:COP9 signalosome catalytic subunit RRI1 [Kazachstania barnettii]CAB4255935.1 similar to Saccharomyces cerevisiae YDL216C RRI1 Catalytic subunit of the COP9 signalosome (CSN) complex that acts as an isopeptidase in cleaving the ubiquitin-like protein Nedd8 from SCF ubiquitin ligases [Kazachstania barnettii]